MGENGWVPVSKVVIQRLSDILNNCKSENSEEMFSQHNMLFM